jgi:hypothetical protein
MVTETENNSELNTPEKIALAEIHKITAALDPLPEILVAGSVANQEYLGVKSWYSHNRDFIILGLLAVIGVGVVLFNHYLHTIK